MTVQPLIDDRYVQKDKKKTTYIGPEHRHNNNRHTFTIEHQELLNVLDEKLTKCRNYCVIPQDAQKEVSHMFGAIREVGEGNIGKGIDQARDQHKEVRGLLSTWRSIKNKVLFTVIVVLTATLLGMIGLGLIQKLKAGW